MFLFARFKVGASALVSVGLCVSFVNAFDIPATGTQVGGNIKLYAFDGMAGTWTDTNGVAQKGHKNTGFILPREVLMVSQEIGKFCSVELSPVFSASAGATPKLGQKIDTMTPPASRAFTFGGWQKLFVKFMLPGSFEVTAGIMGARLSYEYGSETWWDEEFHVNKATHDFGVSEDEGIEIYKNFELGKWSLPVYLYVLNGGNNQIGESNTSPAGLLHIEPQIGPFRLLGSFGYERYDTKDSLNLIRWVVGATYDVGGFSVRGEVMSADWQGKIKTGQTYRDATGTGFYVKPIYQYAKWGKIGVDFSYADEKTNANGSEDKLLNIDPLLIFIPVAGVNIISQNDIGILSRSASKGQKLNYFRSTLGVRCTF